MKKLLVVFLVLVFLALLAAVAGILLSNQAPSLGGPSVVTLRLTEPLPDYAPAPDVPFLGIDRDYSLASIYRGLAEAREDDAVKGVSLYIQNARFGLGKAQELRDLLLSFKQREKFVDCYLETAGEGTNGTLSYYLAAACDHLSLAPAGHLNLLGLYADSAFFRGTLDKLKIEPFFSRIGPYKSAAEAYTEYEHSAAAEEALGELLDDIYDQIVSAIADGRGLEPAAVRELIDRAPLTAEEALAAGLVDELAYPDEFESRIDELAGGRSRLTALSDYGSGAPFGTTRRVAVVFAQGTIIRGRGGIDPWTQQRYLGSETLQELLRELADRPEIVAVVLRIDSPGGSALASDLMLREIESLAAHKPIVVSMSDVAASGGYYIAAKAARIITQPATLTGSIGVTGGKLMTRRFQQELLGISHDTLRRGANADFYSSLEGFTPVQLARFEELMDDVYTTFVGHVADGRSMTPDEVDAVAGGRVWTGRRAVDLGLADELGGLDTALEAARQAAGADDLSALAIDYFPRPPSLWDLLYRRSRPLLSARRLDLEQLLEPHTPQLLELPPALVRLTRPF
ncbi:MAG: signal peptide peptidase SppA [Acidobacteria bacterium]|nr:MAG: signal peptide peptidase SppA [Acidobacteriota bacterium]